MLRLNFSSFLVIIILFTGCTSDEENHEEFAECFTKASMESFLIEPGECVIISENPDMQLVLVKIENHIKTHENYKTIVTVRLEETDFSWETPHEIRDDSNDAIKFSGIIGTGINEDQYTIYVDNIEFTETETEFIFHRATFRVNHAIN